MVELTIKLSREVIGKLKGLQDRVNQKLAPAINQGLERPMNIEGIAQALVKMGVSRTRSHSRRATRDKIIFAVILAQQQIENSKGTLIYKKNQENKKGAKNA